MKDGSANCSKERKKREKRGDPFSLLGVFPSFCKRKEERSHLQASAEQLREGSRGGKEIKGGRSLEGRKEEPGGKEEGAER